MSPAHDELVILSRTKQNQKTLRTKARHPNQVPKWNQTTTTLLEASSKNESETDSRNE
jgi:hypothetical protein